MDPIVLDKALKCVSDMSVAEQILTAVAFVAIGLLLWSKAFNLGKRRADANLQDRNNELRENLAASQNRHCLLDERIRVLEAEIKAQDSTGLSEDIKEILEIKNRLTIENENIWELGKASPPLTLAHNRSQSRLKVLTISNLKGGVGKTTIASNLAAHFDIKLGKRVLLIDLDYQGSLSAACFRAIKQPIRGSIADFAIQKSITPENLLAVMQHLSPILPRTCLIPAGYTLAAVEDRSFLKWILHTTDSDVRYHLADAIWNPAISNSFDVVIIDVGPRLTTASINALFASTHFLIPTNLDRMATETLASFLRTASDLKTRRNLPLDLAGIVGTMAWKAESKTESEKVAVGSIDDALQNWHGEKYVFRNHIQHYREIVNTAGETIAYFIKGREGDKIRKWFDGLGSEVAERMKL